MIQRIQKKENCQNRFKKIKFGENRFRKNGFRENGFQKNRFGKNGLGMQYDSDLSQMSDWELRSCRRKLLHRIRNRRKRFVTAMTIFLIAILAVSVYSFRASASIRPEQTDYKYYTIIEVAYGDTLWDIAMDYMDQKHYKSAANYIAELRSINHLNENGDIKAGELLVVPYFSPEYKE